MATSISCGAFVAAGLTLGLLSGCVGGQRAAEFEAAAAARSTLVGKPAPDFDLPDQDGNIVRLSEQRGHWVVLYFYPKDGTPGCTCQAQEFSTSHRQFQRLAARIFGISPDTVARHAQVHREFKLRVTLLADPDHEVLRQYGAWVDAWFGGRVVRSTVLIDPQGNVAYHWPEVSPKGHAERVRARLLELQARQRKDASPQATRKAARATRPAWTPELRAA